MHTSSERLVVYVPFFISFQTLERPLLILQLKANTLILKTCSKNCYCLNSRVVVLKSNRRLGKLSFLLFVKHNKKAALPINITGVKSKYQFAC